ncbi:hypothetical protein scyTo_0014712 [Scyliorhinus torazame]|uniref:Uncharacterized protein n=1 Tax=Scyliorhinus torazame TaxID=75743 RepID=A0A401NT17_SCYTO|nr:hypothetical protein [Scyliorhinus torazame]
MEFLGRLRKLARYYQRCSETGWFPELDSGDPRTYAVSLPGYNSSSPVVLLLDDASVCTLKPVCATSGSYQEHGGL